MNSNSKVSSNVGLRFTGLGRQNPRLGELLHQLVGYNPHLVGEDWIVPADDPVYREGPREFISRHGQIELVENRFEEIATQMVSSVPTAFDRTRYQEGKRIKVKFDESSKLHEFYGFLIQLVHLQRDEVSGFLKEKILPFMVHEMEATHVTPISIDPNYLQAFLSLIKISFLLSKHDLSTARKLTFERGALQGILPSVFSPLAYIDALTRLAPYALTLPIDRDGCAWHFQTDSMWCFKHIHTEGLYQQFMNDLNPAGTEPSMLGLVGIENMSEKNIWKYLRMTIDGMNCLLGLVFDPKNFTDPNTRTIDFGMQIQVIGALDLLFADLLASNYSTSSYHRQSCAMAALDKLANLKRHLGKIDKPEGEIFRGLATTETRDYLISVFTQATLTHGTELRDGLVAMAEETFKQIFEHYREDLDDKNATDREITERLWHQRNLKHGTFLTGGKFEKLFHSSRGTIPSDIITLPFLLTLAMVLEPREFLRFDPEDGASH